MRETTEKKRKKTAPILCAAVITVLAAFYLAVVVYPLLGASCGEVVAVGILILYGLVLVAVIVGVLLALRQRLKEIEGGEEEDAKQY